MIRMFYAILALSLVVFVHLANGQNTCQNALDKLSIECTALLLTANPVVCNGTCGPEASTVATACENVVSYIAIDSYVCINI